MGKPYSFIYVGITVADIGEEPDTSYERLSQLTWVRK